MRKLAPIQQLGPGFPRCPNEGISALVSRSFTLVSFVQPRHFSVPFFLTVFLIPMAGPIYRAGENNLFFFSYQPAFSASSRNKCLRSPVSRMAASLMLLHPYLPLSVGPPTPDLPLPTSSQSALGCWEAPFSPTPPIPDSITEKACSFSPGTAQDCLQAF